MSTHATPYSTPSSANASRESASDWKTRFGIDSRYIAPVLITIILLIGQLTNHILESYDRTLLAIGTSIFAEIVLSRILTGKWPHLASAYVSGISVGILLRSPEYWPYALCAAIAITSKYVIRYRGRHLWNPSNFAIAVMLLLAPASVATLVQQWDNRLWAMVVIWVLGSAIIFNLKRFHICLTYVATFILLAFVRSTMTGHPWTAEIAPITGPMYQLFIFFMITDPKTTVRSRTGQCVVAFCVALMEHMMRLQQNLHAPYYALFVVGPIANFIDIRWQERKQLHSPAPRETTSMETAATETTPTEAREAASNRDTVAA